MSCNDIPSLLDLQKAKLNADDFGRLMGTGTGTSTNGVTGQVRPTYNKVINDMNAEFDSMIQYQETEFNQHIAGMAFTRVGTFFTGATLDDMREVLLWDAANGGDGHEYGWTGAFPKEVLPNSTPSSTGGIGSGAWVDRSDVTLRSDLAAVGGAGIIGGVVQPVTSPEFAGGADPTGVLSSVAAFTAAATGYTVFVPQGTYLIDANTDLSNGEWEFSRGAIINVAAGVTLTIGNVKAGLFKIFGGAGSVILSNENEVAYPEWFGAVLADGIDGLERCLAACDPNNVRMHIANNLRLSRTWIINGRVPITCNPRASLDATGAATTDPSINGVEIREGAVNWNCKVQLPNIAGFEGAGVVLRGCSLIDLEIGAIANCTDGLVFKTVAATANTVLNNNVRVQSIQGCETALVATGDATGNIFQGNEIYVNFIVGCNIAIEYRGSVALTNFDSNTWGISAIDGAIPGSIGVKNSTPSAISKTTVKVKNWAGGFGSTGAFAVGSFNGAIFGFRINGEPPYSAINVTGSGNVISYERATGTNQPAIECATSPGTALATFNGGVPVNYNQLRLTITSTASTPISGTIVGYACTPLDDGFSENYFAEITSTDGFSISHVRRESKNVIRISVINLKNAALPAGSVVRFNLHVQPMCI